VLQDSLQDLRDCSVEADRSSRSAAAATAGARQASAGLSDEADSEVGPNGGAARLRSGDAAGTTERPAHGGGAGMASAESEAADSVAARPTPVHNAARQLDVDFGPDEPAVASASRRAATSAAASSSEATADDTIEGLHSSIQAQRERLASLMQRVEQLRALASSLETTDMVRCMIGRWCTSVAPCPPD
jgi:hypothetical protein